MPKRAESSLDVPAMTRLLGRQDGVITRGQLFDLGASRADVRRLLARRKLTSLHPGVYLAHTGRPTRRQLEWAAVLYCAPAALHRESSLEAHGLSEDRPRDGRPGTPVVHVLVDHGRRLRPRAGIEVERVVDWSTWVLDNRHPPRTKLEHALLKTASRRTEVEAIALLSDAVQQGRTTAGRLLSVLADLGRLPGRAALAAILADVATGAWSVLEHRYLTQVERAHGLPRGERQVAQDTASGRVRRDVRYPAQHTLVELDGAFGHRDALDRWKDLQRDVDAAVSDHLTLRAGWAQVLEPCRLAGALATILRRRGWQGRPVPCRLGCPAGVRGASGPT